MVSGDPPRCTNEVLRKKLEFFFSSLKLWCQLSEKPPEEAFLFSSFVEFNKCWRSGKRSRLVIELVNGHALSTSRHSWAIPRRCISLQGRNDPHRDIQTRSQKRNLNEKPSVITK